MDDHLKQNYEAFQKLLPSLLPQHRGKSALMRDGELVEVYDTPRDAYVTGQKLYEDGRFSIQEVTDEVEDLGYFSYALPQRQLPTSR